MQRRQFLSTAASAVGLSLAPRTLRSAFAAEPSRVLRFIPQADLAILDPLATTAYVTRNHALMVFDTLFGVDEQYNPQPQMIENAPTQEGPWACAVQNLKRRRPGAQSHVSAATRIASFGEERLLA